MKRIKQLSEKLETANKKLKETESFIERLPTEKFYEIFSNKSKLDADLEKAETKKRKILNQIDALLENIEMECRKQRNFVSQEMKFKSPAL